MPTEQPRKAAGFFTGIPAPAGAGLAMLPLYLWLAFGQQVDMFRSAYFVAPWTAMAAILMVSSVATFGWGSLRLRRGIRFEAMAVIALDRRRADQRALADPVAVHPGLSGRHSVQRPSLCQDQAAARCGCAAAVCAACQRPAVLTRTGMARRCADGRRGGTQSTA